MEEKLTLELLREVKALSRKWFIAFIVVLVMFFVSNLAWLYAWNLPAEETTSTEVVQDGDNGNNNYIGNNGDISNGETDNKKNKNN